MTYVYILAFFLCFRNGYSYRLQIWYAHYLHKVLATSAKLGHWGQKLGRVVTF